MILSSSSLLKSHISFYINCIYLITVYFSTSKHSLQKLISN